MSEHMRKTIVDLQKHLQDLDVQSADTKRTINSLCKAMGESPLYADSDAKSIISSGPLREDQYYGKPLASVVREILEARQAINVGPASVSEIYDRMLEGGFQFESKNADNAKRVLRISLAKNTSTFHKLPGGSYGLREWYPAIKESKKNGKSAADEDEDPDDEAGVLEPVAVGGGEATTSGEAVELPKKPK